jgi:hypothetical protein
MSTKIAPGCLWTLVAYLLLTTRAHAEKAPPRPEEMRDCNSGAADFQIPVPGWRLTWENDSLIGPYGTDEFYSQGMQFGYRFRPDRQPRFMSRPMAAICRLLAGAKDSGHHALVSAGSLIVGQHFFTPGNIRRSTLIPDDRAYAAWLYVGARLEVAQQFKNPGWFANGGLLHTFELIRAPGRDDRASRARRVGSEELA